MTTATVTDAFLAGLESGIWDHMARYYAPDAVFDGTVPGWHFAWRGVEPIIRQLEDWFPGAGRISDIDTLQAGDALMIAFERRWDQMNDDGTVEEVAVRQFHLFHLDGGLITSHRGQCAGIFDAATLARIEAEAPKV